MKKLLLIPSNEEPVENKIARRVISAWAFPQTHSQSIIDVIRHINPPILEKFKCRLYDLSIAHDKLDVNEDEIKEFKSDMIVIFKILLISGGSMKPKLKSYQADYNRIQNKIKPQLKDLKDLLDKIEPLNIHHLEARLKEIEPSSHNPISMLCIAVSSVLRLLDKEDIKESVFNNYSGGHNLANSRKSAILALAQSYEQCFKVRPTATINSLFSKYVNLFFECLSVNASQIDNTPYATIEADIKKVLKKLYR